MYILVQGITMLLLWYKMFTNLQTQLECSIEGRQVFWGIRWCGYLKGILSQLEQLGWTVYMSLSCLKYSTKSQVVPCKDSEILLTTHWKWNISKISILRQFNSTINSTALRMPKTLLSFGYSACNSVKTTLNEGHSIITDITCKV